MNIKTLLQDEMGLSNVWKVNAVNRILLMWQIVIVGFIILVHTIGTPNVGTDLALGLGFLVTGGCLYWNQKGYTRSAVWCSCVTYWIGIAVAVYTGGGLDVAGWMLFMPLILMISVFINARVGVLASLSAALYITLLAWGMKNGYVPPLEYKLELIQKYAMSITPFSLLAIEVYFITQAMEEAFVSARSQKKMADKYASNLQLVNDNLVESEARFRTIVESAADGIVMADENGYIVSANSQLCNWLGYTLDELLNMPVTKIDRSINFEGDPEKWEWVLHALTKSPPWTYNSVLNRKDNSTFSVEARVIMTELNNEKVFLSMVRDITERELVQAKLESSLHEKELLLREIHHRVKNNLQIVTSMLRMQARQSTDPATVEANKALQSRVRSMAIIHQQLYQDTNLSNINFANYIRTLINDIKSIHSNPLISFEYELDNEVNLTVDHALTAGLIVNELVTNGIKHAFPDGQAGIMRCKLKDERPYVIIVCDNGQGGVTQEQVSNGRTMGMQLLRLLTAQLKGTLTVKSDHYVGTQFILTFEDQPVY